MPTIVFSESSNIKRESLLDAFRRDNIDARVFFWPLSSLPVFDETPFTPIAHSVPKRAVNLPSFHDITAGQMDSVAAVIQRVSGRGDNHAEC